MPTDHERVERSRVRTFFWCGFVLGAIVGLWLAGWTWGAAETIVIVVVSAVACGIASARWGDYFWTWLSRHSGWGP